MDTNTAVLITVAIVVIGALAGVGIWLYERKSRSKGLKERFGPEYDKTLQDRGTKREAEAELLERKHRVESLTLRPLSPSDRTRYLEAWRMRQEHFVENPREAVIDADHLVEEVLRARGYPVGDFDRQAADVSVGHPNLVENYRAAHAIAHRSREGQASTEDLRNALLHFRALFSDLLEEQTLAVSA
jgi:FtsZ-interacting cell division protein ZipA